MLSPIRRLWIALLRFAFHLFYNPFAFTYDPISALVSRGHWRDWTRAAIPYIVGTRVLEIPCGTGNLLLDLCDAGYRPIGVDLSSAMLRISRNKLRAKHSQTKSPLAPLIKGGWGDLAQARAQTLPFPSQSFDSIVTTFPPGFIFDPVALAELYRVLNSNGRVIWVDAGRLLPRDAWSRALNAALDATGGEGNFEQVASNALGRAGFESRSETLRDEASVVTVVIASKRGE